MEAELWFLKAEVKRAKQELEEALEKEENVGDALLSYISWLEKYTSAMEDVLEDFNML
jgi:hypothetical protein